MTPTVQTTTEYKTAPLARISQLTTCVAKRATSPSESVTSERSSSTTGSSSRTSDGTATQEGYIEAVRSGAGPEIDQLEFVDGIQEKRRRGVNKVKGAEEEGLSTHRFESVADDDHHDDNIPECPIDNDFNSNSHVRAGTYLRLVQQNAKFPALGNLPLDRFQKRDDQQLTSSSNLSNRTATLTGSAGSRRHPVTNSTLPSLPSYSNSITQSSPSANTVNCSEEERQIPCRAHLENVNDRLSNYAGNNTITTMAAEGDNKDEALVVQQVREVKSRKKVTSDPNHVSHQFFHLEPCVYSHRMFIRAGQIFNVLKKDDADTEENKAMRRKQHGDQVEVDRGKIPEMDFIDAGEQIKTFELTFATLKFQKLFSTILDYVGFFHEFTGVRRLHSLCYVILYDLQQRKFQRRIPFPDEVLIPDCVQVEEALFSQKTKLQANIAKERVKNHAPSIEYLLPEHVRNKDETKAKTPVYLWVNQLKTSATEVMENLKHREIEEVFGVDMSEQSGPVFSIDPHCSDLFTFPPDMDMEIKKWGLVTSGYLVQQDKSSCLAPQSIPFLLGQDHDVIHVNVGTAVTTCHLASLLRHKCPKAHIFAFGVDNVDRARKVARNFEFLGVKNTRVIQDEFLNIDPEDQRFKSVRVILLSANCSKSAITSPVQFIVSEGEDTQILGKLSGGETDMAMVADLMAEHERLLKHALRFPKLQAVVYTTRSRHEAENGVVVSKVLEFFNTANMNSKRPMFKVIPPVLPFRGDEINSDTKDGVDGQYIRFRPSDRVNGCFVAIVAKEPEDQKDSVRTGLGKGKSKTLNKTKSVPSGMADGSHNSDEERSGKSSGKSGRKGLKSGGSASDVKGTESGNSLKSKLSQHKSPAAIGARLYQAGLIKKMEKNGRATVPAKPEHIQVIKHPAPFRGSERQHSIGHEEIRLGADEN